MQLADFTYNLPPELIAKFPAKNRTDSRLMVVENTDIEHLAFKDIEKLLNPGDLLILNNTKVIPARFYGVKTTGAKIEFLLERVVNERQALVYIKANKPPKRDLVINLIEADALESGENIYSKTSIASITVLEKRNNIYLVQLNDCSITWLDLMQKIGKLPLPPYIDRTLKPEDAMRYQTVFAKHDGAVAAPTAGLHFDQDLLTKLKNKGVEIKYITLHVGSGTFAPVRVDNILEHKMHSESYSIEPETVESIINLKKNNKLFNKNNKIIAVGTTSLRCLESLAKDLEDLEVDTEQLREASLIGETDIFIYPGFKFKLVDKLITNFHLPGSTLMMLVSAFAGMENIKNSYAQAIEHQYKFYSYGDAMLLIRCDNNDR